MYPGDKSDFRIAKALGKSKQGFTVLESASSEEENEVNITLTGASAYQEMVHVPLGIRQELLDTPGYSASWKGIDKEHVEEVILDGLCLFLCLLFDGRV